MSPRRRLNAETIAIIGAIEHATGAAQVVAERVAGELVTHTQHDDERFRTLTALVTSVANDVKSLLASRSFLRGTWFAVITVCTLIGVLAGLATAWYRP